MYGALDARNSRFLNSPTNTTAKNSFTHSLDHNSMTPDALLFDLDGLLLDTEVLSKRAFEHATELYELGDQTDFFLSLVGTNEQHHNARIDDVFGDKIDPIAFRSNWNQRFKQMINEKPVPLLPGVKETLEYANNANIKCAVATSSTTTAGEKKIADAGIRDYFLTITCGDQVAISKPHPEIFEKAGASVNADMSRSVGLEDSANGVRAAHGAGLYVIQVPNLVPPTEELLSLGHHVCDSMYDVLELLKNDALQF